MATVAVFFALTFALNACSELDDAPTGSENGSTPTMSIGNQTGVEGYGALFVVRLSGASDSPVVYQFKTVDSSAIGGQDFVLSGNTTN